MKPHPIINESLKRRFEIKFKKSDHCWNWIAGGNKKWYGAISVLFSDGVYHSMSSHVVAFAINNGSFSKLCILHKCDNPKCVNPAHLYEGTKKKNAEDRENRNPFNRSREKNGRAKLNESQVSQIKSLVNEKIPRRKIAHQFNVAKGTIDFIASGRNWKDE